MSILTVLKRWVWCTVDSRYLEIQGTLWNTSRYPYLDISDLQNWWNNKSNNRIPEMNVIWVLKLEIYWKYCGKEEKLLLRSNFFSLSQYSRLSLSRIPRDSLKHFEISVPRNIRVAEVRKPINRTTLLNKWICNLTPEVRDILKILEKKGEIRSNFSSFPQYFVTYS